MKKLIDCPENSRTIMHRMGSLILNVAIWKVNCIADNLIPIFNDFYFSCSKHSGFDNFCFSIFILT